MTFPPSSPSGAPNGVPSGAPDGAPGSYAGARVTVMGLGLNGGGLAVARFLATRGAVVTVTDMKDEAALAESVKALDDLPIRFVLGRHDLSDFSDADFVVKNPAVKPDSPYLAAARRVETDLSLFLSACRAPIIAITGSKGKSTTASAIHHILSSAGKCFLGGNITVSPLGFLDEAGSGTPVVLELSSWQLGDLKGRGLLKPVIAVLTRIVPDHLDRYGNMEAYVADKRLVYADQDASCFTICDRDDEYGRSFASETRGRVRWYADELPPGETGAYFDGRIGLYVDGRTREQLIPERLLVPGPHARRNLLAAALACRVYGMPADAIAKAVATFKGIEHRLEACGEAGGVKFYNDSAATVPEAVAAAVASFDAPPVLVTGGTDKGLDFAPIRASYARAKRVVLLSGTGTDKIRAILDEDGVRYDGPFDDLEQAVRAALRAAATGDVIVFSPGCTSFGMFRNEFDRGRKFKAVVAGL